MSRLLNKKSTSCKSEGYTLVELLLVIGLLALSVGISGDIITSLVRSYNKTQITNEIEQNGNFIINKLEGELRNSHTVQVPSAVNVSGTTLTFVQNVNGSNVTISYSINSGVLNRTYNVGAPGQFTAPISNDDTVRGVAVSCPGGACFTLLSRNPDVVLIRFTLQNTGGTSPRIFTGTMNIDTTVVLRGSY